MDVDVPEHVTKQSPKGQFYQSKSKHKFIEYPAQQRVNQQQVS